MINHYLLYMVQIITESFPISSSGHYLMSKMLVGNFMQQSYEQYMLYIMHIPTACVMSIYFYKAWSVLLKHIDRCWHIIIHMGCSVLLADSATVILYYLKETYLPIHVSLCVGYGATALLLLSLRLCPKMPLVSVTLRRTLLLGIVQAVAFVPGISRMAITFVVARWMHIRAEKAFQISCLLHFPLMVVSSLYSCYILQPFMYELLNLATALSMMGAGIVAYAGISLVGIMVRAELMWLWGIYMFIPIVISIMLGL